MRRASHVALTKKKRNTWRGADGKRERNKPLGTPTLRVQDNIKIYINETGWETTDWIHRCWESKYSSWVVQLQSGPYTDYTTSAPYIYILYIHTYVCISHTKCVLRVAMCSACKIKPVLWLQVFMTFIRYKQGQWLLCILYSTQMPIWKNESRVRLLIFITLAGGSTVGEGQGHLMTCLRRHIGKVGVWLQPFSTLHYKWVVSTTFRAF